MENNKVLPRSNKLKKDMIVVSTPNPTTIRLNSFNPINRQLTLYIPKSQNVKIFKNKIKGSQ
jgi:hypothetical protein